MAAVRQHATLQDLATTLAQAETAILPSHRAGAAGPVPVDPHSKLRVGVDLGTAYLVLVVLDETGYPLTGEWQFAQVARDGLVMDYVGAVDLLRGMKARVERRIGRELTYAATGYPPGVPRAEIRTTANVLEATGVACSGIPTRVLQPPVFVTPLGLALHDRPQ